MKRWVYILMDEHDQIWWCFTSKARADKALANNTDLNLRIIKERLF